MTADDHEIRWTILTAILLWLLLGLIACRGQSVSLAWDYGTDQDVQFTLYASTNELWSVALLPDGIPCGTNQTAIISDIKPSRWWFGVTARSVDGFESALSNVIQCEVPEPPRNLRTIIVQYSATLTNFTNFGFFRVMMQ